MTPERWQQVKEIFGSAIKYGPKDRDVFLRERCANDPELKSEVESLIASHEKSGEFIDEPAYQAAAEWLADEKGELQGGQVIGSYQVLSFISRGGMGEVYLAQDQRLNRKVALKALPSTFTKDVDRLRRFEQEARSASALNHPNIVTIYEIQQLGATHIIATEFVEGETLRRRLSRRALSLSETLSISIQVADALAAAHYAGIVHRDIKPDNVMLRPDGYVKVLDFGLAKLSEQATPATAAEAPTLQVRTGAGIVMGTVGYMSPEQARGREVDERSDIFSLGAMIYEMLTRRKPFEGDTSSDTMAAILKTNPPSLIQLLPDTPTELNRIVFKALKKDRDERYQVVKDLLLDLKALKQELEFQQQLGRSVGPDLPGETADQPEATSLLPPAQTTEPRSAIATISEAFSIEIKRHKTGAILGSLGLVAVLLVISYAVYQYATRKPPVAHFWDVKLTGITSSGNVIDATLSPDGKYIVYALSTRSTQSLYIRQVSSANDTLILPPAPVGVFGMTFSPDGSELYYAIKASLDQGTLYRIPVLGGTPVKILQRIDAPISFAPDGKHFVLVRGNTGNPGETALVISNLDGSEQRDLVIKKLPERFSPIFFTGPSWSPDGKLIAASVATVGGPSSIVLFSAEDGSEQWRSPATFYFTARTEWLPDMSGLLIVAGESSRESQIWLVSYPGGKVRRVTNDLSAYRAIGLTADGRKFSTVQAQGLINVYVGPSGATDEAVRLATGNVGFYSTAGNSLSWTPDGRIVLASTEGGNLDIWVMDQDGGNRKQLTSNGAQNLDPAVSPDGRYVAYVSAREGKKTIWRANMDGSDPIKLTNGPFDYMTSISPDGRWVIFTSAAGARPTTWKVPVDGGTPERITDHAALSGKVSPDGKWIMYQFADSADPYAPPNRIGVVPFQGEGEQREFSMPSIGTVGEVTQWSYDGKSILYSVNSNNVSNIWSQPLDGGPAKQITDFKDNLITGFAYSNDGKRLASTRGLLLRDAVLITDLK